MARDFEPQPSVRWRKLLVKGTFWLSTEIVLGLVGIDNLADYSEFLSQGRALNHVTEVVASIVNLL